MQRIDPVSFAEDSLGEDEAGDNNNGNNDDDTK